MSILHFSLAHLQADFISLSDYTVNDPAVATFRLESDGGLTVPSGTPAPALSPFEWLAVQGAGAGDPYEVLATLQSGPVPSGSPMDTWLPMSLDREWTRVGLGVPVFTLDFRLIGGSNILTTGEITLNVLA